MTQNISAASVISPVSPISSVSPIPTIPAHQRVFSSRDHAALWFSLGVGLLVIQMGAYLVPALGTKSAFVAILVGSVLGSALLAWVAQLGARHGASSAGLMQATYGRGFAKLPVVLNVLQLLGWTAFELVIMRDGFAAMLQNGFGWQARWLPWLLTVFFGVLLYALARGSMVKLVRRFIGRYGLPLVVLSLIWLSVQFVLRIVHGDGGLAAFWQRAGTGGMSTVAAIDLVIAMPVSWLPLVADYARYGKADGQNGQYGAFKGTWLGYVVANFWCYALGVVVIVTLPVDADLVNALLLAQFGLIALGLILLDEMDNAYGDIHSGAVSLNHLRPRTSVVTWGKVLVVLAVLAAMVLNMHGLEPFLLMLSSVFVPLYGVMIARLSGKIALTEPVGGIHLPSAAVWLIGIAVFHLCAQFAPQFGSAIPSLLVSFGLGWLVRK